MNGIAKKIEISANIAIIIVAIMIGVVLVQRYFFTPKAQAPSTIPIGAKLSLPNVDWAKNGRTLVLVLQEGCRFCTDSAPFYQRIVTEATNTRISLVAVFPQPVEVGLRYLSDLKVPIRDVRQASLKSIGVQGTPTLLLINDNGEVINSWIGKLQPEKESDVLSRLQ